MTEQENKDSFCRELHAELHAFEVQIDNLLLELHEIPYHRGSADVHITDIRGKIFALTEEYYKEKYAGYVKLAEDQSLPPNPYMNGTSTELGWQQGVEDMFKVGWRKIEEEIDGS